MKNLIYYDKKRFDIYFKKMSNIYQKSNSTKIYINDINKFNIKKSTITFEVRDFLIKAIFMPLDNYIGDRILNSLKFYFNSYDEDVLYDYLLLDSNVRDGQVKILLYAMRIQKDIQDVLKYIDKSYLVVRPLQFIMVEYLSNKFNIKSGIFINKLEDNTYNIIMFKNSLILLNDYISTENMNNIDSYIIEKLLFIKKEFSVVIDKHVYFLNDNEDKTHFNYKFDYDFLNYTMEEILTKHDYVRGKFSKFWKKRESFKKNA